jgi:uncharacterized membrane protein (TIGR02234 family)
VNAARLRVLSLACCVIGAALALLTSSQVWVRVVVAEPGFPQVVVESTGRDVAPVVAALGLVGLAGAVALLATRGWAKTLTAVVLVLTGAGVIAAALGPALDPEGATRSDVADTVGRFDAADVTVDATAWPWLTVAAGVVLVVGALLAFRAPGGRAMSTRYDADVAGRRGAGRGAHEGTEGATVEGADADGGTDQVDLDDADAVWKALDRGEDPTDR